MAAKTIPLGQSELNVNPRLLRAGGAGDRARRPALGGLPVHRHGAAGVARRGGAVPGHSRLAGLARRRAVGARLLGSGAGASRGSVADDDAAVAAAVQEIERQCSAAGVSTATVADIELVRSDAELDLPGWAVLRPDWSIDELRAVVLPPVDVLLA